MAYISHVHVIIPHVFEIAPHGHVIVSHVHVMAPHGYVMVPQVYGIVFQGWKVLRMVPSTWQAGAPEVVAVTFSF